MAATKESPQLEQLGAEFRADEHKQRSQGGKQLTYVSIDATINRLNEVLGPNWSTAAHTDVQFEGGKARAVTQLTLTATIDGVQKQAYGVGAMVNPDPDMAAKTALAEAIKKAGHQLGIGLYLWDEEARERTERRMKLANASDGQLKAAVYKLAIEKLGKPKPSQAEVAKLFDVKAGDLADGEVNRQILEREGLL